MEDNKFYKHQGKSLNFTNTVLTPPSNNYLAFLLINHTWLQAIQVENDAYLIVVNNCTHFYLSHVGQIIYIMFHGLHYQTVWKSFASLFRS